MNKINIAGILVLLVAASGCASTLSPELASARAAYARAANGPTASINAADLHTAKTNLDTAEKSFESDGDSQKTRDLAYTAERTVETAESRARTMQSVKAKADGLAQTQATQSAQVQSTSAQLGQANQKLASQGQQLANETQRRQDAEKRAAQAAADLAKFATVKQEPRGMVITLSGSVLFGSARWDLLPQAQAKLTEVATALTKEDPDSKMVVEGHTDSQGTAASNQELSQKRAESVRTFLVSRGIAADRITAQGFGPTRSIADNKSPEGRANNRRVEIVVQPSTK